MYFKIVKVGDKKYSDMGMIRICAAFYLEKGDEGYDKFLEKHYLHVPIIPEEGYQGVLADTTKPLSEDAGYVEWIKGLPHKWELNPFCEHYICFEADVTNEEILYCFEWALALSHINFLNDELLAVNKQVNQPFSYVARKTFYEGIKIIPVKDQNAYMKTETLKIDKAEKKVNSLSNVDFASVSTIATYSVK